jgi:hypothetical protein
MSRAPNSNNKTRHGTNVVAEDRKAIATMACCEIDNQNGEGDVMKTQMGIGKTRPMPRTSRSQRAIVIKRPKIAKPLPAWREVRTKIKTEKEPTQ